MKIDNLTLRKVFMRNTALADDVQRISVFIWYGRHVASLQIEITVVAGVVTLTKFLDNRTISGTNHHYFLLFANNVP